MLIRKCTPKEINFLLAPWHCNILAQYADSGIDRCIIERECQGRITGLVATHGGTVAVDEETGLLLGGLVFEQAPIPVFHFAYVRKTHRKLGVLRAILEHEDVIGKPSLASMRTSSLQYLHKALKAPCFFNPWLFNGAQK